jgi:hypothetical protein
MQEDYENKIGANELERRKLELKQKRELYRPIDRNEILTH